MYNRTSNVPEDLREITKTAISFFVKTFCDAKTASHLVGVKVSFIKFPKEHKESLAWCDYKRVAVGAPTEFKICYNDRLKDMRLREYLLTLFHELTHMRQFASGQLKDLEDGRTKWKGKVFAEDTNYWLLPWEQEAQGMEMTAYQLFAKAFPEYKLKRFSVRYLGRRRSAWAKTQPVAGRAAKTL